MVTYSTYLSAPALGEQDLDYPAIVVVRRELYQTGACGLLRETRRILARNLFEPSNIGERAAITRASERR